MDFGRIRIFFLLSLQEEILNSFGIYTLQYLIIWSYNYLYLYLGFKMEYITLILSQKISIDIHIFFWISRFLFMISINDKNILCYNVLTKIKVIIVL